MDLLDRLLEHDTWATEQLFALSWGLDEAQLDQEFDVGLRTLRATLDHMAFNLEGWSALIRRSDTGPGGESTLAALVARHERAFPAFAAFAREIRDQQRMEDTFVDRFGQDMTFGGAILHLILHNEDHRIEALHILDRLGLPGIELDHGLWDFARRGLLT